MRLQRPAAGRQMILRVRARRSCVRSEGTPILRNANEISLVRATRAGDWLSTATKPLAVYQDALRQASDHRSWWDATRPRDPGAHPSRWPSQDSGAATRPLSCLPCSRPYRAPRFQSVATSSRARTTLESKCSSGDRRPASGLMLPSLTGVSCGHGKRPELVILGL